MKEQLVKLETAKLAKEKGYLHDLDQMNTWYEPNLMSYIPRRDNGEYHAIGAFFYDSNQNIQQYQTGQTVDAPTQSQLQKWLREEHDLHIMIYPSLTVEKQTKYRIYEGEEPVESLNVPYLYEYRGKEFDTYEEALEYGLYDYLKLIK